MLAPSAVSGRNRDGLLLPSTLRFDSLLWMFARRCWVRGRGQGVQVGVQRGNLWKRFRGIFWEVRFTKAEGVIDVADHRSDACDDLAEVIRGHPEGLAPTSEFLRRIDIDAPQMRPFRMFWLGWHYLSSKRYRGMDVCARFNPGRTSSYDCTGWWAQGGT
jgi:hypothetical protein